ncbi:MAG: transposase, partial [Acidobacteriaceae bacterium]|nr:transposase [Acidobacteriaceae bacterium]
MEAQSLRERDSYMKTGWCDRAEPSTRADYRNGFYEREYVTRLGTIRLRIARTRGK